MDEVVFEYEGVKIIIPCELKEKMKDIFNKFKHITKINTDLNICFLYNMEEIKNEDLTYKELAIKEDYYRRKMNIKVKLEKRNTDLIKYNNISCPKCRENIKMDIKDYKINLYECKNNHKIENILLNEFEQTQNIKDEISMICDICKKKEEELSGNNKEFFKCVTCKKIICSFCLSYHDSTHDILFIEDKLYLCDKHDKYYISYCEECRMNLCELCKHYPKHKITYFSYILPKKEELIKQKEELQKYNHLFNNDINMIIKMLNEVKNKINIYCKINVDIINNYSEDYTNYETICTLNKFINNKTIEDLRKVVNCNTVPDKFYDIFTIYKKMNVDEISIIYDVKNQKEVRLFNAEFIHNYRKKCKLVIQEKEKDLKEFYVFGKIFATNKDTFEIKLKGITNITNMSNMFNGCNNLISLPDFYKWNTTTITNMSNMFSSCYLLKYLPGISNFDTSNVNNMSHMFNECTSLTSLPDISKWDTSNVIDMSYMFNLCLKLISLPDISYWNISNVVNLSNTFSQCSSLTSLPDISKWDTSNVTDMRCMFYSCDQLLSFPNISIWNTSKVQYMKDMFQSCDEAKSKPFLGNLKNDETKDNEFW